MFEPMKCLIKQFEIKILGYSFFMLVLRAPWKWTSTNVLGVDRRQILSILLFISIFDWCFYHQQLNFWTLASNVLIPTFVSIIALICRDSGHYGWGALGTELLELQTWHHICLGLDMSSGEIKVRRNNLCEILILLFSLVPKLWDKQCFGNIL